MWRNKGSGAASQRWTSDESISISPRCVLDDDSTTTSQSTTTTSAFPVVTATYTDPPPSTSPTTPPRHQPTSRRDGQSWKAVAEAWRSRSRRRLSAGLPTMSSALRRLSIRRPTEPTTTTTDSAHEFCRVVRPTLRTFTLSELKKATRNFSRDNVVGRGGFARVYRGSLPGGELVAVKRLTGGRDRAEGFLAELGHVVNVSHPNIARLVGVGVDGGEHLVFPFSRLGCLSGKLHGNGGAAAAMTWQERYRVAVGTARGLEYLHERCARRIVHRDIKPANILLMDNYEPLICDFGLARWLPAQLTHLQVTVFEGTFGYVPPEYTTHGVFSEKTDVFALGVVLLELLTGRRAVDAAKLSLVAWARQFLDDGEEDEIPKMADPAMGGRYDGKQLRDVAWAGKLCINTSPDHRPRMSQVVQILQGVGSCHRSEGQQQLSNGELHQHGMNGYDAVRYTDDLSRHKKLAFDFDAESPRSCAGTPRVN
ncbi:hypothetical protein PR202_gb13603 [Eleusine coracana subsp. coracana]|uniref:Protein kinase domain-containing protein n=1 Tax=Eleusine coracana subsp. coracana TaxID=191504 RepID=A0AAV5ETA5_ELECO|nr:hypothetical protein QOZ80_9BG0717330 [Eleusine coracana subsp. coracana]GJN25737.1 hypothetical protein PR202_gb13603 [Eleusine coracana subsp. coracana]